MSSDALTLTRHFRAPRARVFSAFVDKAALQSWYGPQNHTIPRCDIDPRPGGAYRIEMHGADGGVRVVTGQFHEIKPHERIVHSWAWLDGAGKTPETLVTMTFADKDGGTELTLVHSGFTTEAARDAHNAGWMSCLASLEDMLAGRPKTPIAQPIVMGDRRSSYVQAVLTALEEKGVAYRFEQAGAQTPELLAVNPFGKMPVFRNAALTLYETSAILRYFEETIPGPSLTPATPLERARMEQWISATNCFGYRYLVTETILPLFFPRGPNGQPDMARVEAARPNVATYLGALDAAYGGGDFIAGAAPSLADVIIAPIVRYAGMIPGGEALLAPYANLRRAHAVFAARPSFIAATEAPAKAAAA